GGPPESPPRHLVDAVLFTLHTVSVLFKDGEPSREGGGGERPDGESAVARSFPCQTCGAPMAPGQDWCLECGTAAPGRLGRRPGMRTATTVVGLTLALVAGAVTAGYAAISGDAGRDAAKPAASSGAPIAQAAPRTPVAPPPRPTPAPATPPPPRPPAQPPVPPPPAPPVPHAAPVAPPPSPAPTPSTPATSTPTTSTPSKPATPAIEPIDLGADAASLYD